MKRIIYIISSIIALTIALSQSIFAFTVSSTQVATGTASGTTVGTFSNSNATYTLVSGSGDEDNSKFTISGNELKLNFTPDYSNPTDLGDTAGNNTYSIRVKEEAPFNLADVTPASITYSQAMNDYADNPVNENGDTYYGGYYNASNAPNYSSFSFLRNDGSVLCVGQQCANEPTDTGYTKAYSSEFGFSALKSDGAVLSWGSDWSSTTPISGVPTDTGYTKVYSSGGIFAALKSDETISCWGGSICSSAPTGTGYKKVYINQNISIALNNNGVISCWGNSICSRLPTGPGYEKVYFTELSVFVLNTNGEGYHINLGEWEEGTLNINGYRKIVSTNNYFAALKSDGTVVCWGTSFGTPCSGYPTENNYVDLYANRSAFAAIDSDGYIKCWSGGMVVNCSSVPIDSGYTKIYGSESAFTAVKSDGTISCWESFMGFIDSDCKDVPASIEAGAEIYTTGNTFVTLSQNGSVVSWGGEYNTMYSPTDSGYTKIYTNTDGAHIAVKDNGEAYCWGGMFEEVEWGPPVVVNHVGCPNGSSVEQNIIVEITDGQVVVTDVEKEKKKKKKSIKYVCGDPKALNYDTWGRHRQSFCKYENKNNKGGFICPVFTQYLSEGDKDGEEILNLQQPGVSKITSEVKLLQAVLRLFGVYQGELTGYYGKETKASVVAWQKTYQSTVLNPWEIINPVSGAFYQSSKKYMNEMFGCHEDVTLDNGVYLGK